MCYFPLPDGGQPGPEASPGVKLVGGRSVLPLARVGYVKGGDSFGKLKLGIIKIRRQFENNQNKNMSKIHELGSSRARERQAKQSDWVLDEILYNESRDYCPKLKCMYFLIRAMAWHEEDPLCFNNQEMTENLGRNNIH